MIGIGGLARSGKDTLASNLKEIIKEDEIKEKNIAATLLKIQERKTQKGNSTLHSLPCAFCSPEYHTRNYPQSTRAKSPNYDGAKRQRKEKITTL